jgi:Cdc6-like AAA superfamily ATPase
MKPKIDKLNFGEVYGENEIKYLENFKDFYYDINNAKSKILNKKKYVVVGRKGTGKTLLANVVCESLKDDYSISKVESLKEFVFHELSNFGGEDISSTKYVPIFEWMIHINIAKNIISSSQDFPADRVEKLKKFLSYFGCISGELKPDKTIEMMLKSQDSVNGGLKLFDFGASGKILSEEVEKRSVRTYLENLENLKDYVLHTLLSSEGKVIIFYDELDDKFSNEDQYKHGIVSFLSAVEKTNNLFLDNKINAKICAVLRSDIINKLNSPNVNRIFEDNSIFLNWEASNSRDTELFDMLAHKIRQSSSYYSSKDTDAIFRDLLPDYIAHEYYKIYILHRTLGRPRDMVRMLTFIQEEYGSNLDKFEAITFTNTAKKYSSYLKREISSELIGHVNDDDLDDYFDFLASVGKRGFTYNFARNKVSDDGIIKSESDLRVMINHLFKAGAICNVVRRSKDEGGDVFYWSYNDEDQSVNLDFNFEIHPGLWDVLRIPKPKNRLS